MKYKPRIITGLKHAHLSSDMPSYIAKRRKRQAKGVKAKGFAFERKVVKALMSDYPDLVHGQWINYRDANGFGYAQPDVYIVRERAVFLFELKYTESETGFTQLQDLYTPLLTRIYSRPVYGMQIVRRASFQDSIHITPEKFMDKPKLGRITYIWRRDE